MQDFLLNKFVQDDALLVRAEPGVGRFRNFLKKALENFAVSALRRDQARKRLPDQARGPDVADLAERVAAPDAPADGFDVSWALQVLTQSLKRTRAECEARGRPDFWGVFEARCLAPVRGEPAVPYQELARRWELESPTQAANVGISAGRLFERNLRAVVGAYAAPEEVEEEIRDLRRILAGAGAGFVETLRTSLESSVAEVTMSRSGPRPADLRLLARLLEVSPAYGPEPGAALTPVLATPVPLDLGDLDPALHGWAAEHGLIAVRLADVLRHPHPPVELLVLAKEFAKDHRIDPDSPLPRKAVTVLYYACIAAALVRCGRRITSYDDDPLRKGFRWAHDQDWVSDVLREALAEGLRHLG